MYCPIAAFERSAIGYEIEMEASGVVRPVGENCHHCDAGAEVIVIVAAISLFHIKRQMAREIFEEDEFIEVLVDAPLHV